MKKLWILLIALSLLLCSCNTVPEGGDFSQKTTDPLDGATYEDIERREAAGYQANRYGFQNDSKLLKIEYPTEWELRKTDKGFDILFDGGTVGYLLGAPADDTANWTVLQTESHSISGVSVTKHIEQENGAAAFRYRYVYNYQTNGRTRTVTLVATCAEIDETSEEKLYTNVLTVDKLVSDTVGALSYYLGEPSNILILGNSFVWTSDIGNILREMLANNGRSCTVQTDARGGAMVGNFTSDEALLNRIRDGQYEAVFLCGLYGVAEAAKIGIIKEACDESLTMLVVFPAHNENTAAIAYAQEEYPTLFCLNWKAELDGLIKRGVDRWDLCVDDAHDHSTPLAGYVGAHMIYRAIYDELPLAPMEHVLSQSEIDSILGDYAYVGDMHIVDADKIKYFN